MKKIREIPRSTVCLNMQCTGIKKNPWECCPFVFQNMQCTGIREIYGSTAYLWAKNSASKIREIPLEHRPFILLAKILHRDQLLADNGIDRS